MDSLYLIFWGIYGLKRKMLAAREDLVNRVSEIAKRRGVTLFWVTNEALEHVVKLDETGAGLSDVMGEYEVFKAAKDTGFVLVPESLLYEMIDRMYRESKSWVVKKWREIGEWFGKYYALYDCEDKLERLRRDLHGFFWNAKEFDVARNGENMVSVRCVSPRFPESYTVFLSVFLEGVLNELGYTCVEMHVAKSFMQLKFQALNEGSDGNV